MSNRELQHNFNIIQNLLSRFGPFQQKLELEFRFGTFFGNKFSSSITNKDFYRILKYFLTNSSTFIYKNQLVSNRTNTLLNIQTPTKPDILHENSYRIQTKGRPSYDIRETFINLPNIETPRFYSTKTKINTIDINNWYTRFAVSEENLISEVYKNNLNNPVLGLQPQSYRIKHRWSFITNDHKNILYNFRVDLTYVEGWFIDYTGNKKDVSSYEVELEVIKTPITDAYNQLLPGVKFMIQLLQNTSLIIPSTEMKLVIQSYNKLFDNSSYKLLNIVNKPINLKLRNLKAPNQLVITDKADGERKLLFFCNQTAYMVYPSFEVSKYLLNTPSDLDNTLFDGEFIESLNEYLIFDLIVYQNTDYRNETFTNRIMKLKEILQIPNIPNNIKLKTFLFSNNKPGNFYQRINDIFKLIPTKKYGNDGLIINNPNDTYTNGKIFKWKPPTLLTIDFLVKKQSGEYLLFSKKDKQNDYILFTGNSKNPFSGKIQTNEYIADKQIVEMHWDYENNTFKIFRIRYDRDQPNNYSTALNIWEDIIDPIYEITIRGHDLLLMRKYHNKIKRDLLTDIGTNKIIVDIGSGNGGDIDKWKQNEVSVLAIEPSIEHINEFRKRLLNYDFVNLNDNVFKFTNTTINIFNAFGQDTNNIIKTYQNFFGKKLQSADCVSIFNSLTFFFENEKLLDSLIKTISSLLRVDGYLIGMVMDGKKVRELFKDGKTEVSDYSWKIIKKSEFTNNPFGNKIEIHLDNTIVTNQIEYLVDFNEFERKLNENGIILEKQIPLVNDELSNSQEKLNQLYTAFVFKKQQEYQITTDIDTQTNIDSKNKPDVSESKLIKTFYSNNPEQNFICIKNNIQKLTPEQKDFVYLNGINFVRIGVVNPTCLLNALLRATENNNNNNMSIQNISLTEQETNIEKGNQLQENIITKVIFNAYKNNELQFLKSNYKNWLDVKKILDKCQTWQWLDLWNILSQIFKHNIIVVDILNPFTKPIIHNSDSDFDKTIVIYNYNGNYDTLGLTNDLGNIKTIFNKNDINILF
jgi:hypothetical protein